MGMTLAVAWLLNHSYLGLFGDAHLYAFQALARIHPELLANDIFLRYGSQDQYTVFTPLYAWLIKVLGLSASASLLSFLSQLAFATTTWLLARQMAGKQMAWLCLGIVIAMPRIYGSGDVFKFAEDFLTARSLAEPLVLGAITAHLSGRRILAYVICTASLLFHPLMAAPGLALLLLLELSDAHLKWALAACAAGAAATVAIAHLLPFGPFALIDATWLRIIRHRSGYLFLDSWKEYWSWVLVILGTVYVATRTSGPSLLKRVALRAFCVAGIGLGLAALSSLDSPVELLLKAQPWRWLWLTNVLAGLMLPLLLRAMWQESTLGACCAILLLESWFMPDFANCYLIGTTTLIWVFRGRIDGKYIIYVKAVCAISATLFAGWLIAASWTALHTRFALHDEPLVLERARSLFALAAPGFAVIYAAWQLTCRKASWPAVVIIAMITAASLFHQVPYAYRKWTEVQIADWMKREFAHWRTQIPQGAEVLWANNSVTVWFMLERPGYMSIAQSAGVVFSRRTALEVDRRMTFLDPLYDKDGTMFQSGYDDSKRTLTREILSQICVDPVLSHVVSESQLDVPSTVLGGTSPWHNYRLYPCSGVRAHLPVVESK